MEIHAYFPQNELLLFCKSHAIVLSAYAPLGSPTRFGAAGGDPADLLKEPQLVAIGKAHRKSPAQILLRWLLDRDVVALPKSVRANRLRENFEVFDFKLSPEERDAIGTLQTRGGRLFEFDMWAIDLLIKI